MKELQLLGDKSRDKKHYSQYQGGTDAQKEKIFYWSSLAYFFILMVAIDKIMILTGKGNYPIVERINTFYPFYKTAQVALFLFITSSIYYLQKLGIKYEHKLKRNNEKLDFQNKEPFS